MEVVQHALAAYGAHLDTVLGVENCIIRRGQALSVRVKVSRGRIRFESAHVGHTLIASGPVAASTVEKFVEAFWFWEKV